MPRRCEAASSRPAQPGLSSERIAGTSRARTTRSDGRSSSTIRANGTWRAAQIAHSVSTLGFALPRLELREGRLPQARRRRRGPRASARLGAGARGRCPRRRGRTHRRSRYPLNWTKFYRDGILSIDHGGRFHYGGRAGGSASAGGDAADGRRGAAASPPAPARSPRSRSPCSPSAPRSASSRATPAWASTAPILMSLTTFAGSAQFAVASVLDSGGAVVAAIAAAVMLNLRYLAVGVSVAPSLRGSAARRLAEAQLAVDESWAVAQRGRPRRSRPARRRRARCWRSAGAPGPSRASSAAARSAIPADYGLDAMFPALFLALLAGQLETRRARPRGRCSAAA